MKKIILIGIGIMIFLGIVTAKPNKTDNNDKPSVLNPTATTQSTSGDEKEQQQRDFLKLYNNTVNLVYSIKKLSYLTTGLLTKVPATTSYENYKKAEDVYKDCSVFFTSIPTPASLKNFDKDFKQSFDELSIACTILQEDAGYMADYINTNNMESYRKSQEEMKKGPIKIMANAISRLVYGVADKIGIDIKPLVTEFKEMSDRIPKDFEAEYGK